MATIKIDLPACKGEIVVPDYLDAAMFNEWWKKSRAEEDDNEDYAAFTEWASRYHFIKSHSLKMDNGYEVEPTGLKLPDMRIAWLFLDGTSDLIEQATDPKFEPGKS